MPDDLQSRCELGQEQLMATEYLRAEITLAAAEEEAWAQKDFDTLSRLYMPLQEAPRQRRQRCGEGIVSLDLLARGASEQPDPREVLQTFPAGQLLVAGWASIARPRKSAGCSVKRCSTSKLFWRRFIPSAHRASSQLSQRKTCSCPIRASDQSTTSFIPCLRIRSFWQRANCLQAVTVEAARRMPK